ncbi:hypothetical protein B0H11DRAFT_2348660, partial [Mycena galericulata]
VILPPIDLESNPVGDLRHLLKEYFEQCWVHRNSEDTGNVFPMPWAEIASDPTKFYDTTKFAFPLPLKDPLAFTSLETLTFMEFVNSNNGSTPFKFKHNIILQPEQPESHIELPKPTSPVPSPPRLSEEIPSPQKTVSRSPSPTPTPPPSPPHQISRKSSNKRAREQDPGVETNSGKNTRLKSKVYISLLSLLMLD